MRAALLEDLGRSHSTGAKVDVFLHEQLLGRETGARGRKQQAEDGQGEAGDGAHDGDENTAPLRPFVTGSVTVTRCLW